MTFPRFRVTCAAGLASVALALPAATAIAGPATPAMPSTPSTAPRPNILLIVADDLGYSDIGAYGSEIATPNLDRLARSGTKLTQFYASPYCSPTRAMLMSGVDHHRAGFGSMAELLTPAQRSQPGYEGYLNTRVAPLPALLRDAGYHTYMAGKWHLGTTEDTSPVARGFEQSFALVQGGASHTDQTGIITDDPDKTPRAIYRENGKPVDLPRDFYSSTFYADRIMRHIGSNRADGKPFFAYLAFTAPHWPLQAPAQYIRKYQGKYDVGYDVIRERRLARMKQLGLVPKDARPYEGSGTWPEWSALSPVQQRIEAKRMAVYAAMVEQMDAQIGRVLDYLKANGLYDNTLVFFMSDNGADGNSVLDEAANREWVRRHANNSLANTGLRGSFVEYGPGWAQVSSTPFHLYKAFAYEGGIAVPAIASLPKRIGAGRASAMPAHVTDIAPTLLELAGTQPPGNRYQGREVFPMEGTSMLAFLSGQTAQVHPHGFSAGWELNGRKAMRQGDWKIVQANPPWGTGRWELYNVREDREERNNVADRHPDRLKALVTAYETYRHDNGVIDIPGLAERKGYSNGTHYYEDMLDDAPPAMAGATAPKPKAHAR